MNLRQKAKHFKQLYEMGLPQKPAPFRYMYLNDYQLYKANSTFKWRDTQILNEDQMKEFACRKILSKLEPLIKDRLERYENKEFDVIEYELDIYLRRTGGNDE